MKTPNPPLVTEPDGPPAKDSGLYGLDVSFDDAAAVVVPVPVEATVSYRTGTRDGPEAVRRASHQVDLYDVDAGEVWREGVRLDPPLKGIREEDVTVRPAAERAIAAQERGEEPDADDLAEVNAHGERVRTLLHERTRDILDAGKLPVVLGGDHSSPLGAIQAAAEREGDRGLGLLHIDAHADLRHAYEGFEHSHASIMHNVLATCPGVHLVQVGLRDVSADEVKRITDDERVLAFYDPELRQARLRGHLLEVLQDIVGELPPRIWVSVDIDGLDPAFCPNTGTPVPGGLDFGEAVELLRLACSQREVVGLDLCEVAPGPARSPETHGLDEWDALVGARLLYKMIGFALDV